ncbi:hypothetical protein E1171_02540 [Cytophagales bacterium RKSG123]|nr:hypothetical protein [Xanthovirga aplysinae]
MIVTKRISVKKLFFFTWKNLFLLVAAVIAATITCNFVDVQIFKGLSFPAGFLGTALAFLIGFRNNSAYARWWEARKIWGKLVNDSRLFSLRVLSLLSLKFQPKGTEGKLKEFQKELIYRHCAFVWALNKHLRKQNPFLVITPFLSDKEIELLQIEKNVPYAILRNQALRIKDIYEEGYTEDFRHIQFDQLIGSFTDILGKSERIKNTIFPRQYD